MASRPKGFRPPPSFPALQSGSPETCRGGGRYTLKLVGGLPPPDLRRATGVCLFGFHSMPFSPRQSHGGAFRPRHPLPAWSPGERIGYRPRGVVRQAGFGFWLCGQDLNLHREPVPRLMRPVPYLSSHHTIKWPGGLSSDPKSAWFADHTLCRTRTGVSRVSGDPRGTSRQGICPRRVSEAHHRS